jgi:DNA-binding SARP family transcriptional activator/nucleoid-associated protein YgaU
VNGIRSRPPPSPSRGTAETGRLHGSSGAPRAARSAWRAPVAGTDRVGPRDVGAAAVGARRALRGLGALAVLAAVLVGVPVALTALGQGPPSALPTWPVLRHALAHNITDSALLRTAGVVCWVAWALFAVAVAIEIVGQLFDLGRRRPASRWRIGIPGLQGWARTLVLSAALLLPPRAVAGVDTSAVIPAVAATAVMAPAGPPVRPLTPVVVTVADPSSPSDGARYVVQRYDSLWAIAERHLGTGTRWREIRDEGGRPLAGDGPLGTTIYPGEVLLLPLDGASASCGPLPPTAAPATAAPPTAAPATAAPPTATAAPPTATAAPATAAPAAAAPATAAPPMATAAAPTATTPAPSTPGATPPTAIPPSEPPPTMVAVAADRGSSSGPVDAGALVEGSLVGAAIVSIIQVLRRRQAQHRPPGRRIRLPDSAATATELALGRSEARDRVSLVEQALAALMTSLRQQDVTPPPILGVLVDDDSVEVLLAHPAAPPSPWMATAEGFRWRIGAASLPAARPEESAPLPALASLGRVSSGPADALINLEAAGLVSIAGRPAEAGGLLYALATQMIGAPWARAVNLILVGLPPGLGGSDNVRCVASLSEVTDELRATAAVMSATVTARGCGDVFTGRLRELAGDGWPPVIVLSAERPHTDELTLLAELTKPGRGVAAVVVNAGQTAHWEIDAGARPCPVNPLRLAIEPSVLDARTVAAVEELIRVAEDTTGASIDDPPYDRIELSVDRSASTPGPTARVSPETATMSRSPANSSLTARLDQLNGRSSNGPASQGAEPVPDLDQPPILVRVLGSVEVDGAAEFKRAKSRELVIYLAMHPNGVGESELDEALWGSSGTRVIASSTRDSTVSVARTAVGGAARLLPAQGQGREKRYQLGPEVQSDWSQFCTLHRYGRQHRSADALRQALGLVRGRPFEAVVSGRTYSWIHTEGHGRHIEAEVADAADLAAYLYLEAGDARSARWAARQGLMAEPYTERLWVRLMEAADAIGESQEIERIMDEMDVVLELEGDFTGLHPNTLAVYDRLSRRHRFPAES